MQSKKTSRGWFLRLERGEEIIEALTRFLVEHHVGFGAVSAIGALDRAELGLYSLQREEYLRRVFEGEYEIVSLQGNLSTVDGTPFPHLHAIISDQDYHVRAGHLFGGRISVTCEMDIVVYDGTVARRDDAETGLKLMDLSR